MLEMKVDEFTYDLPQSRIAMYPPDERGTTKLLVLDKETGRIEDSMYARLPDYLRDGDVLVLNNTKVIPARLRTMTENGLERELLLLELHSSTRDPHRARMIHRRALHVGQKLRIGDATVTVAGLNSDGTGEIVSDENIFELADRYGSTPLPPYLHREAEAEDSIRYQTVFAKYDGSVAAPTASLNLTKEILERIKRKGVGVVELTLHVGLGTFMPIRTDDLARHTMHKEYFEIPQATAEAIRQAKRNGRRVVAVGTTVTRTLEYAYDQIMDDSSDIRGEADIFIYPGYTFRAVDALLTNYHAPKSTVLMMAAAFAGWDNLKAAYGHALASGYAFLSYGDSMLIV